VALLVVAGPLEGYLVMSTLPKRVFWFHYRKKDGKMTIHYKNECIIVDEIICHVPCRSKRNKRQPKLVMSGKAKNVVSIISDRKIFGIIT
jgi:hypothetical protein